MPLRDVLTGAVVMAPMTKGSNLPYRRLAVELGARVLVSEMVVARRLKQKRRGEFALIRRAAEEPCFAVQLAGTNPDEMAWAAALVASRGADFVDVNLGCPIDHFTRKGMGAALARQPNRVRKIVETMARATTVPITVKIRLGWNDRDRNALEVARAAVDGGASALFVHGRTREARYRLPAEWDAIATIAAAVEVPVVGNGDLLYPHEITGRLASSGCTGVMIARGALIKPWIFREATTGYWDISALERVAIYRRYVALGREHWSHREPTEPHATSPIDVAHRADADGDDSGDAAAAAATDAPPAPDPVPFDAYGRARLREFLRWHVGFWCRYVPRRADGTWPSMQARESQFEPRSPLEALLARSDDAALEFVTDRLLDGQSLDDPPPQGSAGANASGTDMDEEQVAAG